MDLVSHSLIHDWDYKMKATITCRFTFDGTETDNEADCWFVYLLEKRKNRWGVVFIAP
jgi:hypothetical protein